MAGRRPGAARPEGDAARPRSDGDAARSRRPVVRRRPARRQRAPFVLLVVGLLCGGLVSLLLLNTMLAQGAVTEETLRKQIAVAEQENEKIAQDYERKTQPDNLAEQAEQQGQHLDRGLDVWNSANDQASQVDAER
jgi:hypothetical protein